jgi:serine/threonine protein kinase
LEGAAETHGLPPFEPPSLEEIRHLFPQLEILALVGKGGMGAVYQARQPSLDRFVALKILPAHVAAVPGFAERFNREARALAKLNHPNIVALHEFGQAQGFSYLIMEFVEGMNLRELERSARLSPVEALQIVPKICDALQFAHDEGIVHRDIKPENILISKKGRVKIADFGIAKMVCPQPESVANTGEAVGTPHYMAPEQVERPSAVDHRADIYSLGVVFFEMLTGELPIGKFASPSARKIEVDVRLDDVVLRALEKDPHRRYQSADDVKTAIEGLRSPFVEISKPETPAKKNVTGRTFWLVSSSVAVIVVFLLALALGHRRAKEADESLDHAERAQQLDRTRQEQDVALQLRERLAAAALLSDLSERDSAMTTLARDAANAGVREILLSSLQRISDPQVHDKIAAETALLLKKKGLTPFSLEVANAIIDTQERNRALSELLK